jgi:hypothetical protein
VTDSLPPGLATANGAAGHDEPPTFGVAVSEADRIRAKGVKIVLADGTEVLCRCDLSAWLAIEKALGSIGRAMDALALPYYSDGQAVAVVTLLSIFSGVEPKEVLTRLDLEQWPVYVVALDRCLAEAVPKHRPGEPPKAEESQPTGEGSTTSEPSSSGEAKPTSGE